MGSKEKLIERFKKLPKDFTFEESVSLLEWIDLHRPHPGSIMKAWMMRTIYQHLKSNGLI